MDTEMLAIRNISDAQRYQHLHFPFTHMSPLLHLNINDKSKIPQLLPLVMNCI